MDLENENTNDDKKWVRPFFTILIGQAFSLMTSAIVQFAIVLYITDVTRSASLLAVGMILGFLPPALLGPFVGVYIDRWSRKKVMIIADLAIAIISLVLVIVGLITRLPLWLIFFVLLARSIGSTFHSPAFTAVTPMIVPDKYLTNVAGYSQSIQSISLIISPIIGALVYTLWNLSSVIALDVAGAIIGVVCVAITKIPELDKDEMQEKTKVLTEAKEALLILHEHKGFISLLVMSAIFFFAFMPLEALYPLMSMAYFNGTAFHVSVVEIAFSVGMLLGGIILGIWGGFKRRIFTIVSSILIMGLSTFIVGLLSPRGFVIFVLMSFVQGLGVPFYAGVFTALMQSKIEKEYMGRVSSLSFSIMSLAAPLGLVLIGPLAEWAGMSIIFFWAGIIIFIMGIVTLLLPATRNIDLVK